MTRRVSKRAMLRRLDSEFPVRIHLHNVRSSSAHVTVDGVTCGMSFPRKARHELLQENGVFGYVQSMPEVIGHGYMPPGTKSGDYARERLRKNAELPLFKVFDAYTESKEQDYLRFKQLHPVGAIVNARVIVVNRRVATLDMGLGLQGRLDVGESLDHTPGSKVQWLPLPRMGDCVVRGFIDRINQVSLSMHTYKREDRYCNYASGYRQHFDSKGACFEKFPWEKRPC